MSGWARGSSWALSLGQRLATEGGSVVVRLGSRFPLRLEALEERGHFAEALRAARCGESRCEPGGLDALLFAKGDLFRGETRVVSLQLRGLDDREDCSEPLVLHDRALVDAAVLVEWRAGKQLAFAADLDSPVLPLEDADALAREGQRLGAWLDEIAHSLEVDDQVAGHRPLLLPGEDAGEVLVVPQRTVGVVSVLRRASEAEVVVLDELRQERVAGFHRRDAV